MRIVFFCSVLAVFIFTFVILLYPHTLEEDVFVLEAVPQDDQIISPSSLELLFVGDIMLGREVESRMEQNGMFYPFQHVQELLMAPDMTIGNFEGIVSAEHVQTPSMGFQFSIKSEYLTLLKYIGFDMLSLANNHSGDFGVEALTYTRELCQELDIFCAGSSTQFDTYSVVIKEFDTKKIGFIFLHTLYQKQDTAVLTSALNALRSESDIQIAYIHWGDEYVLTHSDTQQQLAEFLIDFGVDAVVGHHPHVVQDIALYKNKPIFYSLGNFVFDQYFSDAVQEGLGVQMKIEAEKITYTLIPFSSKAVRNQPARMQESDSQILFSRILKNITDMPAVDIVTGTIIIHNDLF